VRIATRLEGGTLGAYLLDGDAILLERLRQVVHRQHQALTLSQRPYGEPTSWCDVQSSKERKKEARTS